MTGILPIGTVVLLRNSVKKVMITGYYQQTKNEDKTWDYAGCIFPEGFISPDKNFLFDGSQIQEVFMLGYQDQEFFAFCKEIQNTLKITGEEEL